MTPTGQLKEEHAGIKVMLGILGKVCGRLEAGKTVDPAHLEQIHEFLAVFVDTCHHGKEEDLLFPAMEKAGIPREGGPIGVMLLEHRAGRENIRGMGEAATRYKKGDAGAGAEFARNARDYISRLTQHIEKEDTILYPMADARLSGKTQQDLSKGFDEVEEKRIGHGKHEEFHRLMERLGKIYSA